MTTISAQDQVWAKIHIKDCKGDLKGTFGQGEDDWITVGDESLIDGINSALLGMSVGETKSVVLEPSAAYGCLDPDKLQRVPMAELPRNIQVGDQFTDSRETNCHWTVTEIHKDFAILSANHPLAGQTVTIDIEIFEIKAHT